ncbi:MAG: zf-TFIIB domain-containing protein [Paraglaciecola polaris]|uniref:TFIIB-type zinc ribbon-containing protein n=1 Tax=Paraglaciecola polaris TaxID=222814 RepID=UPI00300110A9
MMLCPRTHSPLKKVNVGKVPVFVSEVCAGVFFENATIQHFEKPSERRGATLAAHLEKFHGELLGLDERVNCPTCTDTVMLRRFYSLSHAVKIDECPGCGGIWLDTGELAKLQSLLLNEKERALLRAQLIETHRPSEISGLPHIHDNWLLRDNKISNLIDLTFFLTGD